MNDTSEHIQLYTKKILRLASSIPLSERLEVYDASAKVRSPLCGSTVTVDVVMCEGKIAEYGQDVKACALGQAAASVVGSNVIGRTRAEIELAEVQMHDMLENQGSPPSPPFEDLSILLPARNYRNRHASIMLVLKATREAIDKVGSQAAN